MTPCLIAFAAGALYEVGCVLWVHNGAHGRALAAGGVSLFIATAEVTGILQAIGGVGPAVAYVLGCAAGTTVAVAAKRRGGVA